MAAFNRLEQTHARFCATPTKYPIGGDRPRANTGSDTWPLDVSAALTGGRRALIVAVVNATEEPRTLDLTVQGFRKSSKGRCWTLIAPGLDAQNSVGKPSQVVIRRSELRPEGEAHCPSLRQHLAVRVRARMIRGGRVSKSSTSQSALLTHVIAKTILDTER